MEPTARFRSRLVNIILTSRVTEHQYAPLTSCSCCSLWFKPFLLLFIWQSAIGICQCIAPSRIAIPRGINMGYDYAEKH